MTASVAAVANVEALQSTLANPSFHVSGASSFARMMAEGVADVDRKTKAADAAVTAFALDDTVAPHRVMFALAEAQRSTSMMMQVRSRLVEGYQELMRMQM